MRGLDTGGGGAKDTQRMSRRLINLGGSVMSFFSPTFEGLAFVPHFISLCISICVHILHFLVWFEGDEDHFPIE